MATRKYQSPCAVPTAKTILTNLEVVLSIARIALIKKK